MACVLVSCSDDPTDPNPGGGMLTMPKTGSTFTYEYVQIDTSNGLPIEASRKQMVATIGASGISYAGRDNCVKMSTVDNGTTTDSYFSYPSSGDLDLYQAASTSGGMRYKWTTIPTKSKGSITTLLYDTTMMVGPLEYYNSFSVVNEYVGAETITLPAGTLEAVRIKQIIKIYMKIGSSLSEQEIEGYFHVAPALGVPVKYDYAIMRKSSSGAPTSGAIMELQSYDLK